MKLSDLLYFKEHLDKIMPTGSQDLMAKEYDPLIYYVENHPMHVAKHLQALHVARAEISQAFENFDVALDQIAQWIDHESQPLKQQLLSQSYKIYEDMTNNPQSWLYQADAVLNQRAPLTDENRDFVVSRLMYRNTWKDAALIIRPGLEDWINHMVAFDPLYVFDHSQDFLAPAKSKFNDLYVGRVRWCTNKDLDTRSILENIPDGQIGFCFAWYFFHWKPFEVIKQYLSEIYSKLKPGGVFAFTFNDGDRSGGANNAERFCGCFVPASMIKSWAESQGFITVMQKELDRATTWIELQKPGSQTSIKAGQAQALIIPKSQPPRVESQVDNSKNKTYTQEQIEIIIQQALDLNIDTAHQLRHAYSPQKLETIIRKRKSR